MKKPSIALAVALFLAPLQARSDEGKVFRTQIESATTVAHARAAVQQHREYLGPSFFDFAAEEVAVEKDDQPLDPHRRGVLLSIAEAVHAQRNPARGRVTDPKATVREALAQAGFRDPGRLTAKNWAGRGLDKVWEWIAEQLRKLRPESRPATGGLFSLEALTPIVWALIVLAVGTFLVFATLHFSMNRRRKEAKATGLVDPDEADRTADEWLTRADELLAQGEHRLAVRCLYVASLVRLDEANVARFRPGETNWEHLRRIQASPRLPAGLDFRPPTERFDRVWYGHRVEGAKDVERFRAWYQATVDAVRRRPS